MITIYHLNASRSERIVWLMEELGLPYKLEQVTRETSGLAPAAFRDIHPLGKAPVIHDGDTVLIESGAIIEYIIQRYGQGRFAVPVASPDYARYLQWFHFAEGSAMLQFLAYLRMRRLTDGDETAPLFAWARETNTRYLHLMNDALAARPYYAGEAFTAADIMMVFVVHFLKHWAKLDLSPYPNFEPYLDRIGQRPAYQKAMAIANPPG
jgi:glutathione S-transferase